MDHPVNAKAEGFHGLVTTDLQTDLAKTLGNSEDHLRILIDLLPICLFVHRGGKIIYANPGLVHLLGYEKAEEPIGRPALFMALPEARRGIDPKRKDRGNIEN
jgi:PAS domain-containing protein